MNTLILAMKCLLSQHTISTRSWTSKNLVKEGMVQWQYILE